MEVDLVTDGASEDENYGLDDNNEEYINFEGERCGICMDIVIDRGVLDCCQHWFCFTCIDNWATITSLCPLCQHEFQMITCVPVYDTIGGNNSDDETSPRDEDWFVEGNNNTVSFPSYYIDENAVVCLDGDGCQIRSGSATVEENSDIDTSIACDSCDKWFHAFCVGFDAEGTSYGSWFCPRCSTDGGEDESQTASEPGKSFHNSFDITNGDDIAEGVAEVSFSGRMSISIAGDGETAVVVSLVEENKRSLESSESEMGCSNDVNSVTPIHSISPAQLKTDADCCVEERASSLSDADPAVFSSVSPDVPGMEDNAASEDCRPASVESHLRAENMLQSLESTVPYEESINGNIGGKRKNTDIRSEVACYRDAREGEAEAEAEAETDPKMSRKKVKASNDTPDITDIIQETKKKSLKQRGQRIVSLMNPEERAMAAGFRLKKIMRRGGEDDKDSSALVQEIRKSIREAIRNKSSEDQGGENLFDPKLLDAFRAALASSGTENRNPTLDLKAKRALLQKGKVRENLTRKIYGSGGKRKRAWTRDCEVEFWKHRCAKATKPEKVQALKSVLDLLREKNTDSTKEKPVKENVETGSILSRLYLADTSVFPRKMDIKPVSTVHVLPTTEQTPKNGFSAKSVSGDSSQRKPPNSNNLLQANVTAPNVTRDIKLEVARSDAHKKHLKGASNSTLGAKKASSENETESKPDVKMSDRRKWALELLARKSASSSENMEEKEEDSVVFKEKYALLAQLPKEMRPVLAPSCHNKIPVSIRQAQLHRLAEHFLKKANLSSVCRSAEIELAVADAVNIEKQVADKSNSKLVYVNLCSQELLRRSDGIRPDTVKESLADEASPEEANSSPVDAHVDEALRKAGLMSDSPPNSPLIHQTAQDFKEEEDPENIVKVDSRSEFDIYGDDGDGNNSVHVDAPKASDAQLEEPKIKMLLPEKPVESSDLLPVKDENEAKDQMNECDIQNPLVGKDEGLSLTECEEPYGPEKPPLVEMCPDSVSSIPVPSVLVEEITEHKSDELEKNPDGDKSKESPSKSREKEKSNKREKTVEGGSTKSEPNSSVVKKVEVYIKEHIRPLCKSGVITVEQYRWAVGKATEKVMKYHTKEKNANFLIKEGEKVKKLAEQYVEASQKGKS